MKPFPGIPYVIALYGIAVLFHSSRNALGAGRS
jgi:hypothetical protein